MLTGTSMRSWNGLVHINISESGALRRYLCHIAIVNANQLPLVANFEYFMALKFMPVYVDLQTKPELYFLKTHVETHILSR